MRKPILVDTGPLVAILSDLDQHHRRCVEQLREITVPLLTCWPVITEAAWLLREYPKAILAMLGAFQTSGFQLAPLAASDLSGIAAVLTKYRTLDIQVADAALVHIARRESIDTIFTLDRRDFSVLRGAHNRKFRLIP